MRNPHKEILPTPFGDLQLVVWEESMFVTCGAVGEPEHIIINGVAYKLRLDLRFEEDEWKQTYFSSDRADQWGKHMSPSARAKFFAVVPDLMLGWAENNDEVFKRLKHEAEVANLESLDDRVAKLRAELASTVQQRDEASAALGKGPAPELDMFEYQVDVYCGTKEEADKVMAERMNVDEDYGFHYKIEWDER